MRLKFARRLLVPTMSVLVVCIVHPLAPLASAQEAKSKIRIAIPSPSICCLHLFAAQQWKVFEDNGLDVEIIQMRPQVANAAMVAGEIHYFAGVGPNSVAATLRGMSSRAVWFASDQLIYSLMARPEFRTLSQLRSRRLAVGGLGDTTEVSLRMGWKQRAKARRTLSSSASATRIS